MNGKTLIAVLGSAAFVGGCGEGLMGTDPQLALPAADPLRENMLIVGSGLGSQPATLDVTIPVTVASDILTARLRWVGRGTSATGDNFLTVNSHQRAATLLASWNVGGDLPWVFVYEWDAKPLLRAGSNRLFVSGFDLPGTSREDGVALIVTYRDNSSPWTSIQTFDPYEFVESSAGTVWQYAIGSSPVDRNARFVLLAGDATASGPDRVWLDVARGPVPPDLVGVASSVMNDALAAGRGDRLDLITQDVVVPARASHFAYQIESPPGGDSIVHFFGALCIDGEGSFCTGSIGGRVWNDVDRDGADLGEPALAGVNVILRDGADAVLATAVTDESGAFVFDVLCTGDYVVDVDESTLPEGFEPTSCVDGDCSPLAISFDTDAGWAGDLAFGYAAPLPPPPVVGCFYRLPFWQAAFHRHRHGCRHGPTLDEDRLLALLPIVQASTGLDYTRGDGVLSYEDVAAGLRGRWPGHDGHRNRCNLARRQFLVTLLNYAYNGAPADMLVDSDRDGETDMTFGTMLATVEQLLESPDRGACSRASKMSFSVNGMGHEGCP